MNAIKETHYHLPNQTGYYKGKVRDVYTINNQFLAMVVTDRISAFDVVLPEPIPYKGQVLNQIAANFLKATADIVPNLRSV
jgi:phosphoribosylaminoimidazole-succinocarboxamide synthase